MVRRITVALVVVVFVATLAACGGGKAPDGAAGDPATGSMPTLDGATLLESRCVGCHELDRVDEQDLDFGGWVALLDTMIDKGARLTPEEKTVLAGYLADL